MNKQQLIKELKKLNPNAFIEKSESFDGRKGGVWLNALDFTDLAFMSDRVDEGDKKYLDGASLVCVYFNELFGHSDWLFDCYDSETILVGRI